jgi:hypothetical protein
MNIKLTEYIGASAIALNIKDVPMTALPGIKDAFVRLCETVEAAREPAYHGQVVQSLTDIFAARQGFAQTAGEVMQPIQQVVAEKLAESLQGTEQVAQAIADEVDDKPRRGRPKKAEATEGKEPAGEIAPAAASMEAPSNGADTASNEESTSGSSPVDSSSATTPETASGLSDITDSELQKYCAKLAAHFGDPKKVFDLAQPFVPEGAVARPTNIKDNAQRHAFIQAAEAASGQKYHG